MNSSRFEEQQLKKLCSRINSNPKEVRYIVEHIDEFYRAWTNIKKDKKTGESKKYSDGTPKKRTLEPSRNALKRIQKSIKDNILDSITLPDNVHGGVKSKNNVSNAKPHQGNKFLFTTDLDNFFPSISHKAVYASFLAAGCTNVEANWLTKLTTWKYHLPQGTPTSTHIANIVFIETDRKLIELCKLHSITYTRFVDDLTFSSAKDFKPLLNDILEIVQEGGFKISYRKTEYQNGQSVTGITVKNNFIDAPKVIKEKAKKETESFKPISNYVSMIQKTNKGVDKKKKHR